MEVHLKSLSTSLSIKKNVTFADIAIAESVRCESELSTGIGLIFFQSRIRGCVNGWDMFI